MKRLLARGAVAAAALFTATGCGADASTPSAPGDVGLSPVVGESTPELPTESGRLGAGAGAAGAAGVDAAGASAACEPIR